MMRRLRRCIIVAINAHSVPGNETSRRIAEGGGCCLWDDVDVTGYIKVYCTGWNEPDATTAVIFQTNALLVCIWKLRSCVTL